MSVILSAGKNLLDDLLSGENGGFKKITEGEARMLLKNGFVSAIGLPQTAELFSSRLGFTVSIGKKSVTINPKEDIVIVGEYDRSVCLEADEHFPKDALIDWYLVEMKVPTAWVPPKI